MKKKCNYGCYMDMEWNLKRKEIVYIYSYDILNIFILVLLYFKSKN